MIKMREIQLIKDIEKDAKKLLKTDKNMTMTNINIRKSKNQKQVKN